MTPRPTPLAVRVEEIPDALKREPRWVVWHFKWREATGKWTKVPHRTTDTERTADTTDATTWGTFDEAVDAYFDGKCDGIGFVLGDGRFGLDVDGTDLHAFVLLLNSYTETSATGRGVHVIAQGTKPGTKCRTGPYELYDHDRFFAMTGHHVAGSPMTVEERSVELATLYAQMFPNGDAATPPPGASSSTLEDDVLIDKASRAPKSGEKFTRLFAGDTSGYASHSEADLALCSMLAFWTNRDAAQMDRLFRRSKMWRPKWDERRGASSIGADLIAKAIASTPRGYAPDDTSPAVPIIHEIDVSRPAPTAPYRFTSAFAPDHFVSEWIAFFATQCDAAYEYFEATGLLALSLATHDLSVHVSGAAEPLRTNLYVAFVGDAAASRKSTAKDFLVQAAKAVPHVCGVLPEMASHEGTVEALAAVSGKSALWAIDELKPQLDKLTHATYLAGMLGLVLELYGKTHYTYQRVSKRRRPKDGLREPDAFDVVDVTFSIIGCCTPTIFERLTSDAVESGLLPRFAIIWPTGKPDRMPRYQSDRTRLHPSALICCLHAIAERSAISTVRFEEGVLDLLDRAIDRPIEQDAAHSLMTKRVGVMAQKVAMLSAASRTPDAFDAAEKVIRITEEDAHSAIVVVRRWIEASQRFEARINETVFEKHLKKCLDVVRGRAGHVNRREIARRVHVEARMMKEIEATLVQRGQIEVVTQQGAMGAPATFWRWIEG